MIAPVPENRTCLLFGAIGRDLLELLHEPLKARVLCGSLPDEMEVIRHEAIRENFETVAFCQLAQAAEAGTDQSGACETRQAARCVHGDQIRVTACVVEAF